jgi:predicted nucleic acid-binding protein
VTVYLLDTTAFSHLMRDEPSVLARISSLSATDTLTICSTVRGEILYGLERLPIGARRAALEAKAQQLFSAVGCEPIAPAVADIYARFKRTAQQAGMSLDENDLWIAATARSVAAVLVTSDGDYSRLSTLRIENWLKGTTP